ncbi:MAG: XRE family transcriptional regulator [Phycisphaerales bacterium]|nr:MAG: XRE family transcriptional regulator [Phycisphaerales bacterium]
MSAADLPYPGLLNQGLRDVFTRLGGVSDASRARSASTRGTDLPESRVTMSVLEELESAEQAELRAREQAFVLHGLARRQAAALLSMSDEDWAAFETIRADFTKAAADNDTEAITELIGYALEILAGPISMDDFVDEIVYSDPQELEVIERVDREREAFFDRYFELKAASGLETQADVAKKAGLSPTTVHAIESRSVRPQFKTLKKLAVAFGVEVSAFSEPAPPARPKRARKPKG